MRCFKIAQKVIKFVTNNKQKSGLNSYYEFTTFSANYFQRSRFFRGGGRKRKYFSRYFGAKFDPRKAR